MYKRYLLSERKVFSLGNSKVITLPQRSYDVGEVLVLRMYKNIMILTPKKIDEDLIINGKIFDILDGFRKTLEDEREILNKINFYKTMAKKKGGVLNYHIERLTKKLDKLRIYDES